MNLIIQLQRYTSLFDMSGHPTITLPGGVNAWGLAIASLLVAGQLGEATLTRAGTGFQGATSWHGRRPVDPIPWRGAPSEPGGPRQP